MLQVNGHAATTCDPATDIEVSFGAPEYSAAEGGTAATATVALGRAPRDPLVVPLTVSHNGGAKDGDHSAIPQSLTVPAGVGSSRTFTVRALDDSDDDGESVTLGLVVLPPGYVADLTGLEHAVNLTRLDLSENPVTDLSPLTALVNLRVLELLGVKADPWPLAGLGGFIHLSLRDNGLGDLRALAEFVGLEVLELSGNQVIDLRPLSGMQALEALRLDAGPDLSVLEGLGSLDALDVRDAATGGLEFGSDER